MKDWASNPHHADTLVQGKPLKKFIALCISERHKLAHGDGAPQLGYEALSAGLREVVLSYLSRMTNLPEMPVDAELYGDVLSLGLGTA